MSLVLIVSRVIRDERSVKIERFIGFKTNNAIISL